MERERILLVRLSALGDVVQCLPALSALRQGRPDAEIGWLVEDRNAGVLENHPQIDRLFRFERRKGGASAAWRVSREVRSWAPHVSVDLQGNLKGALLTRLCAAPRRIGLPRGETREGMAHAFATEFIPPGPPGEHRADRALRLVAPLGAKGPAAPVLPAVRPEARDKIALALAELGLSPGRYALLLPGTSDFGAFKRWPARRFGELAVRLAAERGLPSLVSFGPGQRELADAVVAAAPHAARLAPDASLNEFMALASGAAIVVGADSGPVVMASILGVPTVALFGPKDPRVYAPRGARTAVVWKQVYCSPCLLRRCGDPICMTTMETSETWQAVERLGALV